MHPFIQIVPVVANFTNNQFVGDTSLWSDACGRTKLIILVFKKLTKNFLRLGFNMKDSEWATFLERE